MSVPAAANAAQPNTWAALWRGITSFQKDKFTPSIALRNSIGVTVPLIIGAAYGPIAPALTVATGALNVAFSDSHEPYLVRARRMLAASVLVGLAVCVGSLVGEHFWMSIAFTGAWAFLAGLLVALSTEAADLGVISLVTLVVFAAVNRDPDAAVQTGLLAMCGGLLQTSLSLALWRFRPYVAQRRALGELFLELAKMAHSAHIEAADSPPASAQSSQAQHALSSIDKDRSVNAERYRMLLSQAERTRLGLLVLRRLRARIRREAPGSEPSAILDSYFDAAASTLEHIGQGLLADKRPTGKAGDLAPLQASSEQIRAACDPGEPLIAAMIRDARSQMDAIAGQLRAAIDMAAYANVEGAEAYARREAATPWTLRLAGTFATLWANVSFKSAAFRHAVRLAVCVAAGEAIGRRFGVERAYWLPMTIAIILKPDFSATFIRGVLRLAGTLAGLVVSTGMVMVLPAGMMAHALAVGILTFVLRCFGAANYGLFVTVLTALVVALFTMNGVPASEVIGARGINTVAGGAIALLAYWLWPTWERTQSPELLARMLNAYREYFHSIVEGYIRMDQKFAPDLDRRRWAGRLARSNMEASLERLSSEPGTPAQSLHSLNAMMAASHRMVQAMMALEAGLSNSRPVPPRPKFIKLAEDVELTLSRLAAGLRQASLTRDELPDLREDHNSLVASGDSLTERYALVNVETDRITNSLNTLTEETLQWLGRA